MKLTVNDKVYKSFSNSAKGSVYWNSVSIQLWNSMYRSSAKNLIEQQLKEDIKSLEELNI